MSPADEAIELVCAAANQAQYAACLREEAENLYRQARELNPDGEWSFDPDGLREPEGVPENWMDIGDAYFERRRTP